jgi:hypothetical protein
MVKVETLGMFKTAKNDPTVIADGETINGYIHTKGSDGKADAPVAGASGALQADDLLIALNTITGDYSYNPDTKIASGDFLNSFYLSAWDNQNLIVNEDNISYAGTDDYTDITAGTTVMVAHTDGKLRIADGTTLKVAEHKITFPVLEKIQFDGNAIVVKVAVA